MTRLASDIRETTKPIYCSSCFNSQDVRHVDFDAACDRGYGTGPLPVAMDDLVLCENCVKEAGRLVGMEDTEITARRIETLERQLDSERKIRRQAEKYADAMELAMDNRPQPVPLDHRKKPRKLIEEAA